MTMPNEPYAFDDFRIDTRAFRLTRGGAPVPLEPKAFDLLVLLVGASGRVVTKPEILEALWKDTAVTDNALTRIVAQLRRALGDDAREARYIETVPTRGYRWIGPTEAALASPRPRATDASPEPTGSASAPRPVADAAPQERGLAGTPSEHVVPATAPTSRRVPRAVLLAVGVAAVVITFGAATGIWSAVMRSRDIRSVWMSQVTTSPGLDVFPALSPDGRSIAYSSDADGAFEIVVRSFGTAAAPVVVTRDGQQNVEPAWSPDGAFLAYHSMARGGVWIVPAVGGVARQVSAFGSRPSWSPDGASIAFQSDDLSDLAPHAFGANPPSSIWIVDRGGGLPRLVTKPGEPPGGHASPAWLPGGHRLVFAAVSGGRSVLWSIETDGVDLQRISSPDSSLFDPAVVGGAVFAATGSSVLVRIPIDASTGRATARGSAMSTASVANGRYLSVGRDGRFVVSGLSLQTNLWSVGVSRDGAAAGAPRPLTNDTLQRKSMPAFSPDGARIAFAGGRAGVGPDIWIVDADGRNLQPLRSEAGGKTQQAAYFAVSWFPDSRRLAYLVTQPRSQVLASADLESRRESTMLALAGGEDDFDRSRQVTADVRLSPDGTHVAYSQIDASTGRSRVFIRPVSGGAPRPATSGEHDESFPAWSRDGRWLAFEIGRDGSSQIGIVSTSGGPVRQITSMRGEHWIRDWSPDSDTIVFAGLRGGVWNVRTVSTSNGVERQLTDYASPSTFVRYPAWSPRGDQIVYEFGELKGNIWTGVLPR